MDQLGISIITIFQAFLWIFWKNINGNQLYPLNQWVFLAVGTNTNTPQQQSGIRYTLPSTSTQTIKFATRGPTGSFYDLAYNATVFIGGDNVKLMGGIWVQNVRLYLNYFPTSKDEMLNLAIMSTGNIV